jgi:hypothetical protein
MKLYFNYSINCEQPGDARFHGPPSWEEAEESVRGFVEVMSEVGLRQGATLFIDPEVARKQGFLFRQMADAGIETALHLNGWRYSKLENPAWLGSLSYTEQLAAIRSAKNELEDILGRPCLGYRACRASANDDTFPILEELGFEWSSTSAAGSYRPEDFACWPGGWPFPYHPSPANKLIPGTLTIYEMPVTRGPHLTYRGDSNRPLDLRAETPPEVTGPGGELWRQVVEETIVEMGRRNQPMRAIIIASHNSHPFANHASLPYHNLKRAIHFARQVAVKHVYELTPSHFNDIKNEASHLGTF